MLIAETLQIPLERVKPDARFIEDIGADSLELIDLLMEVERTFDVEFSPKQYDQMTTVGDLARLIDLKKGH